MAFSIKFIKMLALNLFSKQGRLGGSIFKHSAVLSQQQLGFGYNLSSFWGKTQTDLPQEPSDSKFGGIKSFLVETLKPYMPSYDDPILQINTFHRHKKKVKKSRRDQRRKKLRNLSDRKKKHLNY